MFAYLRAFLCMFVAAPFLVSIAAEAQVFPASYARLLTFDETNHVLHCPLCNYPPSDGTTYFVRTVEGLNVAFADLGDAMNVVEALNAMADAQRRCDRAQYDLALNDYEMAIGSPDQEATDEAEVDGVFGLLYPRRKLSSLFDYVVPPYHGCGSHRAAIGKANPGMAKRAALRWSRR
jgi:hypothetical protein